jgi:hypothetical protein
MSEEQEWQPAIVNPVPHGNYWQPRDEKFTLQVRGKRVRIRECLPLGSSDCDCKKWFSVHPDDTPPSWPNWMLCEASILTD